MTKKELIKVRATHNSITVVPDAPQKLLELISKPVKHDKMGPRNLVYMGSFMPYKNVEALIAAMKWLPNHTLHLLTRITPKRKSELMANMPANAHVVFYNGVTDEQYATLLADNAVLVTASRDEGYGLPIAEALAMGVPAVVSEMTIFHEVAGEGALYADPDNPHDFADQILKLDNPKLRETIIEKGGKHIAQFSWPKSAQILLDLAKSIL
jgi:glycosyltransferase involved in cell wall biosynthesis